MILLESLKCYEMMVIFILSGWQIYSIFAFLLLILTIMWYFNNISNLHGVDSLIFWRSTMKKQYSIISFLTLCFIAFSVLGCSSITSYQSQSKRDDLTFGQRFVLYKEVQKFILSKKYLGLKKSEKYNLLKVLTRTSKGLAFSLKNYRFVARAKRVRKSSCSYFKSFFKKYKSKKYLETVEYTMKYAQEDCRHYQLLVQLMYKRKGTRQFQEKYFNLELELAKQKRRNKQMQKDLRSIGELKKQTSLLK